MTKDNHRLGNFGLTGIAPAPRGVPQIVVTFNIDANGILNVSAQDKASGKTQEIQITTEDRTPQGKIDEMVRDAEQFSKDDEAQRERVAARNELEGYVYQVKGALDDPQIGAKVDAADKASVGSKCEEMQKWMDGNMNASKAELAAKREEFEAIVKPVMMQLHGGSAQSCGQEAGRAAGKGPTIEEVD